MACGKGFTFADDLENDPVLLELSTPDPDVATASVYIGTPGGLLYGLAGTSLIKADTFYSFAWDGAVRAMDTTEGSQAVFAPPLGGTKGLTKLFDVGSVPNPAFVQLSSKVDAAVAAKVKAAVLGFAQRSALDGWKGAESYGSLAGRMGKRTKRPIFAPPQRIRLADPDVLEVAGVGAPATPDIKNHFWAP